MRYSLHNEHGHCIGEAETAQGIADIAKVGTWAYDTDRANKWPCIVFVQDSIGLLGLPFELRSEAMRACAQVNRGEEIK